MRELTLKEKNEAIDFLIERFENHSKDKMSEFICNDFEKWYYDELGLMITLHDNAEIFPELSNFINKVGKELDSEYKPGGAWCVRPVGTKYRNEFRLKKLKEFKKIFNE